MESEAHHANNIPNLLSQSFQDSDQIIDEMSLLMKKHGTVSLLITPTNQWYLTNVFSNLYSCLLIQKKSEEAYSILTDTSYYFMDKI